MDRGPRTANGDAEAIRLLSRLALVNRFPIKTTVTYLVVGALWILLSDTLILTLARDPATITRWQNLKGWFYVIVTALILYVLLRRNLTTLRQSLQAQALSEERYQRVLDTTHEGVWMLDADQKTTYVNQRMAAMLGYAADEIMGRPGLDFVDEAFWEQAHAQFARRAQGVATQYEICYRRKDGAPLWAIVSGTPLFDTQGRFAGSLGMVTDITERKRMEETLRATNQRLQALFEASPLAIITLDQHGMVDFWNPAAERIFGWSAAEATGKLPVFVPDDKQEEFIERFRRVLRGERLAGVEGRRQRKDGSPLDISIYTAPLYDAEQHVVGTVAVMADITERKRMEEDLRLSNGRLSTLHEIDRGILEAQSPAEVAQVALARMRKLMPRCDRVSVILFDWDNQTMQLQAVHRNGETRLAQGQVFPLSNFPHLNELQAGNIVRDDDLTALPEPTLTVRHLIAEGLRCTVAIPLRMQGRVIGALALSSKQVAAFNDTDVRIATEVADQLAIATQHTRLRQGLERTNAELQAAVQAKDEMIANVSHELRTPLTHIMGYADLLADGTLGELPADSLRAVQIIQTQSIALSHLVNRLLDLQTLSPDQFNWTAVDLAELVSGTALRWHERAQKASITLATEIAPHPLRVWGDYDKLTQAFSHLLENAIKFMPDGGAIAVRLARVDNEAHLSVTDTGIGIPPEHLARIFTPFYQVDGSSTRRFGGAGIGLALTQKIIALHGGRIWAESDGIAGHGTTIHMALPIHAEALPAA